METRTPILVTGGHRTGTTWTGKILASAPDVIYVHEPFHVRHPPGICPVRFTRWFQHIDSHNEKRYHAAMSRIFDMRFALWEHVTSTLREREHFYDGTRGVAWAMREWTRWTWGRLRGKRPLVKDPLALLAAEWIADRFNPQVVLMVRHPAGFVNSHLRADWSHDFRNFTEQPEFLERLPPPLVEEIQEQVQDPGDLTDQACLLWNVLYTVVEQYRERHPDWTVVRNEDLATTPKEEFRNLCNELNIAFDASMEEAVSEFTTMDNPDQEEMPLHATQRDSQSQAWKWKRTLDGARLKRIRKQTAPVWKKFYDPSEWEIEG